MALKFFDRTKEDASSTGTGTFSLSGTASTGGFRTFQSVHTSGDEVFYSAVDSSNSTFEVGRGTLTSGSPWTLSRDTILSSSNSNNKVNFAAAPNVFSTYPAGHAAFSDTSLASNVVETDAVFDETLTANKALSGQFKGTLQFNKAYFTIANYTIASGRTLTVTDSADLYAVGIASGTKMDRTADFTSDVTISANTLFSPSINAYATVTIASGVTATVSPVGTTFVNNGSGISTGGPISWKLPSSDGSQGSNIITDGKGGFAVQGATSGAGSTPTPTSERLIKVFDYISFTPSTPLHSFECMIPTTIAETPDLIESFRIKFLHVDFGGKDDSSNVSAGIHCFLAPLSAAGGNPILDSSSANYGGAFWYRTTTSTAFLSGSPFTTRKDQVLSSNGVSNGSYECNTYGFNVWGYNWAPSIGSNGSSTYYGPSIANPPFSTSNFVLNNTNLCGDIEIYNTKHDPKTQWQVEWNSYGSNYTQTKAMAWGMTKNQGNSNNTIYNMTSNHAQGYRLYFLPGNVNYFSGSNVQGLVGGRIEFYATIKQNAAEMSN